MQAAFFVRKVAAEQWTQNGTIKLRRLYLFELNPDSPTPIRPERQQTAGPARAGANRGQDPFFADHPATQRRFFAPTWANPL